MGGGRDAAGPVMSRKPEVFVGCEIGDCGCPEETYIVNGINLIVHYEPDGTADAFLDGGDWGEVETTVEGMTRFAARHAVFAWAFDMTAGPET